MVMSSPYKRLNVDRRMVSLLSIFAVLGICLVGILLVATNSLSALRSYSTMQTHWTEARKEATYQISQYIMTGDSARAAKYCQAMAFLENLTAVRLGMTGENPDRAKIRNRLLDARMLPFEIAEMITTYNRFKDFSHFRVAVAKWGLSDSLVYKYEDVFRQVQQEGASGQQVPLLNRIESLDHELTLVQYDLAAALTRGTYFLNQVILWIAISLGSLLLIISSIMSFRFLRSIKKWRSQMSESEQRYRSLYEQNPNAVFSMDENGRIYDGNKIFERQFREQYKSNTYLWDIVKDRSDEEVYNLLDKVRHEQSLGFLTVLPLDDDTEVYFYMMLMPIFVGNKMCGIFGVAEDITFQKRAEAKIKNQLKEKTVLLAEIHHRVKNNLAVVSGLLELQQGLLKNIQVKEALEEAKGRIQSMAMIHEQIYQNEDLSEINFQDYIYQLSEHVKHTYEKSDKDIDLHINTEDIKLTLDQTIPCGLIINELLSNAYKYAFKGREQGNIWIRIYEDDDNIRMDILDDGVGLPDDWEEHQSESLGLTLVQALTEQLEGKLTIDDGKAACFGISFEKEPIGKGFIGLN